MSAPRKDDKSQDKTYGVVYANDLARRALEGRTKFPEGSIIVREKLSKPDDTTPQLLAVMFKRAPGFNLEGGDWEFLTVNGALTKVTERQKQGKCLECHSPQRERDFVFTVPTKPGDLQLVPVKAHP